MPASPGDDSRHGENDAHACSASGSVVDPHRSSVRGYDLRHDRQTKTASSSVARACRIESDESVERPGSVLGGNSRTIVSDREDSLIRTALDDDLDGRFSMLHSVVEHVPEHTCQISGVTNHDNLLGADLNGEFGFAPQAGSLILREEVEVHFVLADRESALVGPGVTPAACGRYCT